MPENFKTLAPQRGDAIRVLLAKLLLATNAGGGGGTGGSVAAGGGSYEGHFAGGIPTMTPTAEPAAAVDLDTGRLWWYYNSQWQ